MTHARSTYGKDRPVARRRMTLRRIDPWSVLKFGAVVNVCLFVIMLLGSGIVWFAIRQLGIIDQACGLATDVGFEDCAVNGGNLFRYLLLLGLLWVVIQTGLFVFFAFLHNLIADLVGGISVTLSEEGTVSGAGTTRRARRDDRTTGEQPTRRSGLGAPPPREGSGSGAATAGSATAAGAAAAATGRSYGASGSQGGGSQGGGSSGGGGSARGSSGDERSGTKGSGDGGGTPYDQRAPSAPPTTPPREPDQRPASPSGGWPWDPQPAPERSEPGPTRPEDGAQRPERADRDDREDREDDQLFGWRDER